MPAGTAYALLGPRDAGRTALVRCAAGIERPTEGRALVFGRDARASRDRLALVPREPPALLRRLFRRGRSADEALERARARQPDLLVLDDPPFVDPARAGEILAEEARRGRALFFATADPRPIAGLAQRIGILIGGRLVADEGAEMLTRRFRRIHYRNEITETRREYGTELDAFDAVAVKARGWGVEAIVSNFDPAAFERFRALDGVADAREETLPLETIVATILLREGRG